MRVIIAALALTLIANAAEFSNKSSLSIVEARGNSQVSTYNLKTDTSYEVEKSTYSSGGHYTLSTAENDAGAEEENARNFAVFAKYARELEGMLSSYGGIQYEGDRFSGFERRTNYDVGFKYKLYTGDILKSFAEVGYRYTQEKLVEENEDYLQKGRVYFEIKKKQNPRLSYEFWVEYLPNFTIPDDYIVSLEPSVIVAIDSRFSFQVSYKAIYDNQVNIEGNDKLDTIQSTSLVAKF